MRKIVLDLATTLDGFIEGPDGEVDWCIMDDDMGFDSFLDSIDTVFYGRTSYDAWGNYQPPPGAGDAEQQLWRNVHAKEKIVFSSRPLNDADTRRISTNFEAQVRSIKQQPGKDIWLYGGARLVSSFIKAGLIDVYRISVHPVVLGEGKPLFQNLESRLNLQLVQSKAFRSGVVQLVYATRESISR